MVCTRLGSLLCPLFYFLDDISYPQSVHIKPTVPLLLLLEVGSWWQNNSSALDTYGQVCARHRFEPQLRPSQQCNDIHVSWHNGLPSAHDPCLCAAIIVQMGFLFVKIQRFVACWWCTWIWSKTLEKGHIFCGRIFMNWVSETIFDNLSHFLNNNDIMTDYYLYILYGIFIIEPMETPPLWELDLLFHS